MKLDRYLEAYPPGKEDGLCIWFTGLPCAGKTTLAEILTRKLKEGGHKVTLFDGDIVRTHISKGLGFTKEDRITNILRVGSIASELVKHNAIAVCALASPYESARTLVREVIGNDRFILVYLNTSLEVCEKRDDKGMYAKARRGEIKRFTGIDDPYEPPLCPDLIIDTSNISPEEAVHRILDFLRLKGFILNSLNTIDIHDVIF